MLARLLTLSALLAVVLCMYNSDPVNWNRHPYLVKVIVRDIKSKNVSTCTGTLVSTSTVLTSSKCFQGKISRMEAQAVIPVQGSKKRMNKAMLDVRVENDMAIMRIDPIKEKTLCEGTPFPSRVSRLNIRPSLSEAPFHPVATNKIEDSRCRVIGFETMEDADDFAGSPKVQMLEIDVRTESENMMFSEVNGNSTGSACWEDIGAPLECTLNEEDVWVQVGFLHSIYGRAKDSDNNFTNSTCSDVQAMKFVVFSDNTLSHNLEIVDKAGVFYAHDKCF